MTVKQMAFNLRLGHRSLRSAGGDPLPLCPLPSKEDGSGGTHGSDVQFYAHQLSLTRICWAQSTLPSHANWRLQAAQKTGKPCLTCNSCPKRENSGCEAPGLCMLLKSSKQCKNRKSLNLHPAVEGELLLMRCQVLVYYLEALSSV